MFIHEYQCAGQQHHDLTHFNTVGGKVKGHQIDTNIRGQSFELFNQTCHNIFSISRIEANHTIIIALEIEFMISIMNHYWLFVCVCERETVKVSACLCAESIALQLL